MDTMLSFKTVAIIILMWLTWYFYKRYNWFATIISKNPTVASRVPVYTKKTEKEARQFRQPDERIIAPKATFRQYLKYLKLACLPYTWTIPFKFTKQIYLRQFKSKLTPHEKRQRLAKMLLETSLILGFKEQRGEQYYFQYQNFRMPSRIETNGRYHFVHTCSAEISIDNDNIPYLINISVDDEDLTDINQIFAFLNTLWCVYTHTMTHVMAGSIAEINIHNIEQRKNVADDVKESIDDMHAVVSGMNESANHYPADIWGIPRQHLQIILGYNAAQQIGNHQTIIQCYPISNFIRFTMKARKILANHLSGTGISISTIAANTIFHSIDHYNMGKYFLHDSEKKTFSGIDARMITSLLGDLNYDLGRWQGMKYTKYLTWQKIYKELKEIDSELADKTHMFVSV